MSILRSALCADLRMDIVKLSYSAEQHGLLFAQGAAGTIGAIQIGSPAIRYGAITHHFTA
jgi:hypothetical protein